MLARKPVSLFVVAAFVLFESACVVPGGSARLRKTVKRDIASVDTKDSKLLILNVITKAGENIAFEKGSPGRFAAGGESVAGTASRGLEFDKKDVRIDQEAKTGRIRRVETSDGRIYDVIYATQTEDKIQIRTRVAVDIPVSEIQQVWIGKSDTGGNTVIAIFAVVGSVGMVALLIAGLKNHDPVHGFDSCPFVYSFNGKEYVLDAEPYGMAITEGLKRMDWVEMSGLRDVDGKYRVLLANELDETQYTDELKLVAVDHAAGLKVAPDIGGRMHTFGRPIGPTTAFDGKGRDILPFVAGNDPVFWVSRLEEKSADDPVMRDELVFEFPKPAGAKRAKLLANVWTTQWASRSARLFLELYGSRLPEAYEDVDRHGPTYGKVLRWMSNEEIATMKVWVETPSGWKARSMIYGGAPVITKDKAYLLDIGDVAGETLRIKLRPPVNCWMVNSLAVDYGEDEPIEAAEIAAEKAFDPAGRDVRGSLAATDGSYLAAPNRGESTELVFPVPPLKEGLERTLFVKASGYYKIHIDSKGEPQTELIARVLGEPDFAARYTFLEYQKWEAGLKAQAERAGVKRGSDTGTAKVKRTQKR